MFAALFLFLLLWILAGAVVLALGTRTPRHGTTRLVRSCDRRIASVHSEVTVRLWPSAHDLPSCERDLKNYRVVQILDHSSSMGAGPGSPLEHAISAAVSFAENVMSDRCQMGVVEFDQAARIVHPVSSSKSAIVQSLRGIAPGGATDIALGLRQAWSAIQEMGPAPPETERMAVLLSDGGSDAEAALQAAKTLKDDGVRVVVIAFGSYVSEDLLRKIASSDDDYFHTLDPANLVRLYEAIGSSMEAVRGFRARVNESVARANFLLTATGYAQPVSISFNDGTAEWFVPFVTVGAKDIPYQIVPTKPGWHRIGAGRATIEMVDHDGLPYRASSNESPHLLVLPRGWWAGLAVIFHPLFWMIWEAIWRKKTRPYHIAPAPARQEVPLPDAKPVQPSLRNKSEIRLKPALLIGIGYTGLLVLRAFRYHLARLIPNPQGLQRYLWIDTGLDSQDDAARSGPFGDPLPAADCILLPENVQPEFQRAETEPRPPHLAWLNTERARRIMVPRDYDLSHGTLRRRVLGRAALYQHLESGTDSAISKALDERLISLDKYYRVIVIGHTGGGTGGGMLTDVLLWTKKRIAKLQQEPASVDALLLTHRMLDDSAAEPALCRNTQAFAGEFSRLSNRRHLPLSVPQFPADATEVQGLVDKVVVLEHPLEAPTDRTQWPGPVAHSAAETILALLLDSRSGVATFLDDQVASWRGLERTSGNTIVCAASATSRWLPVLEVRRLITARTVLDFVSRDFLRLEIVSGVVAPIRDIQAAEVEQDDVRMFLEGGRLIRPRPELLGSLAALADEASSPAELARLISRMDAYPGSAIPMDIGGDALLAEVLQQQQELCAAVLEEWALRVLNGEPRNGAFDPAVRRGGFFRLSAAAARLDTLSDACIQNLNAQEKSAKQRGDTHRFECVRYLFLRYRLILRGFRRHLDSWAISLLALAQQAHSEASAARYQLQTVLDELSPYALWSPEIEADLVARYGEPVRGRLLDQVMWTSQVDPDGATRLAVRVQGCDDKRVQGSLDQVLSLRLALEELVPELELSCGLDLYLEDAGRYVDWNRWLRISRTDPVDMDSNLQAALAARPLVRKEWAYIAGTAQPFSGMDVVPAAYPYRAAIVRVLSDCALFAAAALGDVTRRFPQEAHSEWPFLDPVDRMAAAHEDRFAELGLTAPTLSPAMRTYFLDRDMLRAFALAHGFKWLAMKLGRQREALFFKNIPLSSEQSQPGYPVVQDALDHFVILGRTAEGEHIDRDAVLAEVESDLAGRDAQAIQDLSRALPERFDRYLEDCPAAVRTDFLNLTHLFLELELRRRAENIGAAV